MSIFVKKAPLYPGKGPSPTFGKGLSKVKVMRVKSLVQEYDLFLIFVLKIWEFFFVEWRNV